MIRTAEEEMGMVTATVATSILTEEWCSLLSVSGANEEQDFFELGGDSLMAIELITRVAARGGGELPAETLFLDGSFGAARRALVSVSTAR